MNLKARLNAASSDDSTTDIDDFVADVDNLVLMTSKDAVKCASFANEYCWSLNVTLQLPKTLIDDVLRLINKSHKDSSI